MQRELLTAEELGALLHLSPDTVLDWARQGRLPAHRFSPKVIRFDAAEVLAVVAPDLSASSAPQPDSSGEGES